MLKTTSTYHYVCNFCNTRSIAFGAPNLPVSWMHVMGDIHLCVNCIGSLRYELVKHKRKLRKGEKQEEEDNG